MNESEKSIKLAKSKDQLDHMAWLLDNCFRVPGLNWRFGLEALIGLIPGAGDVVSGALGILLLIRSFQFRLPKIIILRMIANTALDITVGSIPVLGDIFDFFWKSNTRNMDMFKEYASSPEKSTTRHWLFIGGLLAFFLGIFFVLAVLIYLLFERFSGQVQM